MAHIQDRHNAGYKASVDSAGALLIRGGGAGGAIQVITGSGDEAIIVDDTTTTNITYVCYAPVGTATSSAAWKIKRLDETGSYLVIDWADGDANYDNIADNRASLSYS